MHIIRIPIATKICIGELLPELMSHIALCIIGMTMAFSIIVIHKEIFTFIVLLTGLLSTGMCTHAQKVSLVKKWKLYDQERG